ncbi:MAG: hypothetical protein AAFO99_08185 [Bacteroidota bacterium]
MIAISSPQRSKPLIVQTQIDIKASKEEIWSVLIAPQYIAKWDSLPPHHSAKEELAHGTVLRYPGIGDDYTEFTVSEKIKNQKLTLQLYCSHWQGTKDDYDISYEYTIHRMEGLNFLELRMGDFDALSKGIMYFDASLDFANNALNKIKAIAENL